MVAIEKLPKNNLQYKVSCEEKTDRKWTDDEN